MSRDNANLLDVEQAATKISEFIKGIDKNQFLKDEKTQSAVLHQLLVIGEAVKRLSMDYRRANPGIPWDQMTGMRDRLIYGYDQVNLARVWKTATQDIPKLTTSLKNVAGQSTK